MKKSKPVSISLTDEQLQDLKELAKKCDMSVSRVIHMMTIYMTYNTEGIQRMKHLEAAFLGSAPDKISFKGYDNKYYRYADFIKLLVCLTNHQEPYPTIEGWVIKSYYEITGEQPSRWNQDIQHTMEIAKTKWIED